MRLLFELRSFLSSLWRSQVVIVWKNTLLSGSFLPPSHVYRCSTYKPTYVCLCTRVCVYV